VARIISCGLGAQRAAPLHNSRAGVLRVHNSRAADQVPSRWNGLSAEGFFVGGADGFVGAAAAGEAALGGEFAGANVGGGFLDDFLRFVELLVSARS
jgi:hypothetical protein